MTKFFTKKIFILAALATFPSQAQESLAFRLGLFAHPSHPNKYYIDMERGPEPQYIYARANVSCDQWQEGIVRDDKTGLCFVIRLSQVKMYYKYRICDLVVDQNQRNLWIDYSSKRLESNGNSSFRYVYADGTSPTPAKTGRCKAVAGDIYYHLDDESMGRVFELDEFMAPILILGKFAGLRRLASAPIAALDKSLKVYTVWRKGKYAFEWLLVPAFWSAADSLTQTTLPDWTMDDDLRMRFFRDMTSVDFQGNTSQYTDIKILSGSQDVFKSTGRLILPPDADIVHIAKKVNDYLTNPDRQRGIKFSRVDGLPAESCGVHMDVRYQSSLSTLPDDCIYYAYRGVKFYIEETWDLIQSGTALKWSWSPMLPVFKF